MNSSLSGTKGTILLVDDNIDLLETMAMLLEMSGYKIYQAKNAVEALEVIKEKPDIDVILTDVVMPGPVRSIDLASKIKDINPNVEVVFTSGYRDVSKMLLEDDALLIHKPYSPTDVDKVVEKIVKKRGDKVK